MVLCVCTNLTRSLKRSFNHNTCFHRLSLQLQYSTSPEASVVGSTNEYNAGSCPHRFSSRGTHTQLAPTTNYVSSEARPFEFIPRVRRQAAFPYSTSDNLAQNPSGDHVSDLMAMGGPAHLHELIHARHESLGGMFVEEIQGNSIVFVADNDMIRQVFSEDVACPQYLVPPAWLVYNQKHKCRRGLFFMSGEEWRSHRSILNRYLLRPSVAAHCSKFNLVIDEFLQRWHQQYGGLVENTEKELYHFSVEILAQTLFGERFGYIDGQLTRVADTSRFSHLLHDIFSCSAVLSVQDAAVAAHNSTLHWQQFERAVTEALDVCGQYVGEKIEHIKWQLQHKSVDKTSRDQLSAGVIGQLIANKEPINNQQLVSIVTDLFLAAGDTTAHSTQWALYRLCQDTALQQRLASNIATVAPSIRNHISPEHIDRIPLVKAIFKETLRLYPVAPFLTRLIQEEMVVGGYTIPAQTPLCISLFTSSRCARFFPEPLSFQPDRWLRHLDNGTTFDSSGGGSERGCDRRSVSNRKDYASMSVHHASNRRHKHACMPFSTGVRGCVGRRIAELQVHTFLARLIQKWRISNADEETTNDRSQNSSQTGRESVKFVMRMVGVMSESLRMRMAPR